MFLFFTLPALAQVNAFTVFDTTNSGIHDNAIHAVLAESNGLVWVGTDNGLARFDGSTWVIYDSVNSDLPSNYVRCIARGLDGRLWVGTFTGGLAAFDGSNWQVWDTGNSPLPENHVRSLGIDSSGVIWVGTVYGLGRFDGVSTWEIFNQFNSVLYSNNISALYVTGVDSFWAGTINGGMVIANDTSWTLYNNQNSGLHDNSVLGIGVEPSGRGWVATPAGGLFLYAGNWTEFNFINSGLPTNALKGLAFDNDLNIWTGSGNRGIIHFDGVSYFEWFDSTNSPVPDINVTCVSYDKASDVLWAGTFNQGLVKLETQLLSRWKEENALLHAIQLYPNPVEDHLKVQSGDVSRRSVTIELFDLAGTRVWAGSLRLNSGAGIADLSMLPKGLYLALVSDGDLFLGMQKLMKR